MINYKKVVETKENLVPESYVCDKCGKILTDTMEIQEMHFIRFTGGYSSIFGDCSTIECDLCQECLMEMIKGIYREDYDPSGFILG